MIVSPKRADKSTSFRPWTLQPEGMQTASQSEAMLEEDRKSFKKSDLQKSAAIKEIAMCDSYARHRLHFATLGPGKLVASGVRGWIVGRVNSQGLDLSKQRSSMDPQRFGCGISVTLVTSNRLANMHGFKRLQRQISLTPRD
jgi:hypothetical protein